MSSLPLKHRRKSLSSSPPPSPPSPDISPLRPSTSSSVYRYTTSAYTRSHKWTGSDYDDVPDFEPALISDDALTALSSSSRAPSLAPSDADVQDAYVDIVSSSPIHDIPFLRPSTPPRSSRSKFVTETDDKASMAREDVAAALLALHAYPRLGSSPLTATFPTFPALLGNSSTRVRDFPIPRTPSPTLHLPIRLAPITRLPSPGTEDRTSRASIDRIQKDAGSSEGRVHGCDVSADNFSQHQGRSKTSTPERQGALYSPLPPSSPFSEDEREDVHEDIADSPIAKALSKSQSLTQSSPLRSPSLERHRYLTLTRPSLVDSLPAKDTALPPSSPLSSPPSSPIPAHAPIKRKAPAVADDGATSKKPRVHTSDAVARDSKAVKARVVAVPRSRPYVRVEVKKVVRAPTTAEPEKTEADRQKCKAHAGLPASLERTEPSVEAEASRKRQKVADRRDSVSPATQHPPLPLRILSNERVVTSKSKTKPKVTATDDLPPKQARDSERESIAPPPAQPALVATEVPKNFDAIPHSSDRVQDPDACPRPTLLGILIESLALSRASSLTAVALLRAAHSTQPADTSLTLAAVQSTLEWGARLGTFGCVESSGEHVPPTYFYDPARDPDAERADVLRTLMPRPGKRAETRKYKQYYWRPVVMARGSGSSETKRSRRHLSKEGDEVEGKGGWEVDWEE